MSVQILRTVDKKLVAVIVLDATISYEVTHTARVTQHPVEEGSPVTDHVEIDPTTLAVTGVVSNTPVTLLAGGIIPTFDGTRVQSAYEALVESYTKKELLEIQTELDVFSDYVISQLTVPRDRTNFHAFRFTARFAKVTKVGTQVVLLKEDAAEIAAAQEDLGKQTPEAATPEEEGQSSYLVQLLKGTGLIE